MLQQRQKADQNKTKKVEGALSVTKKHTAAGRTCAQNKALTREIRLTGRLTDRD